MSSIWGNALRVSLFGQSHGAAVGAVLDGFPAGVRFDMDAVEEQMRRRRPGGQLATPRSEPDIPRILSGVMDGVSTGAPIAVIIENTDTRPADYRAFLETPRPSHADYTAGVRYGGFQDFRGGGHFSARLTAPLVFAGALCRQFLARDGVTIGSHIKSVGAEQDDAFDAANVDAKLLARLSAMPFPVLSEEAGRRMRQAILTAVADGDSLGGVIECTVAGLPEGLGSPIFGNVESRFSSALFGIPAVKGVEFGSGFGLAAMRGSEANDAFVQKDGKVRTKTNHSGGILGGITNGMPLVFRVAIKPTPSIAKPQRTLNVKTGEEQTLCVTGRHDPCVAVRGAAVVEAVAAIAAADLVLERRGYRGA